MELIVTARLPYAGFLCFCVGLGIIGGLSSAFSEEDEDKDEEGVLCGCYCASIASQAQLHQNLRHSCLWYYCGCGVWLLIIN